MAVDMFLKIPGIDGESADQSHRGEIDILSWSWGMSQSGTTHLGSGGGSGKVSVQDITLTKYVDAASPALLLGCCKGTHLDEAVLDSRMATARYGGYLRASLPPFWTTTDPEQVRQALSRLQLS